MKEYLIKALQYLPSDQAYLTEKFQNKKRVIEIEADAFMNPRQMATARVHSHVAEERLHRHNYVEVMYLLKGEITHVIDDKEITMKQGDLLLMNQNVEHLVKQSGEEDVGIILMIRPEFFDIPFQMMKGRNMLSDFLVNLMRVNNPVSQYLLFHVKGQCSVENLMENLLMNISQEYGGETAIGQYTLGLIFLYLTRRFGQSHSPVQERKEQMVHETLQYIDSHYKTAKLGDLAQEFHQTLPALSKLIRQETGATFQELLMKKRFIQATCLLRETDLCIEEIAVNIGYENLSYFYRRFKQQYRMTPSQYRVKYQKKSADKEENG